MIRENAPNGAPGRDSPGRRRFRAVVLALVGLAVLVPPAALGHDGLSGIALEPQRVNPGGVIVVRGDNVATDDELRVALVGGSSRTELATVLTDGEGHFSVGVDIPVELPVGGYAIEVDGPSSGVHLTAPLSIEGSPIFDGEEGAPAGQDEGLPALPSVGGQAVPGPVATARPVSGSSGDPGSDIDLVPVAALGLALGGLGLFVRWSRRRPPAATGSADLP